MRLPLLLATAVVLGCAPASRQPPSPPQPNVDPAPSAPPTVRVPRAADKVDRIAPPAVAYAHGWMPLASTGVDDFVREHPTYDGRGVLIAILDTGVEPGVPGLRTTSTGAPKLVDLRDFSGEGTVPLVPVAPRGDTVLVAGRKLAGFGRVVGLSTSGVYFAGTLRELALGTPPASDLDGDGEATDTLAVVVTRATDGWIVLADTDGDGSLAGEQPVRDYQMGRETFGWAPEGSAPRVNLAANLAEREGKPVLDLVFALDAHGTHVAGIAAAHDLYGVEGFDGVAPGAQLLGLKISNRANGSVSTTGAILAAMDHAIRFAAARRQPLVINLSFGVGNEREGEARIDLLVDSVLARHPELPLTVSAGNDGPGLSTIGFPGSASRAISVGGTVPSVFLPPDQGGGEAEIVADFSARGGELAKPDVVAPAVAYSSVPLWNAGEELKQGTSMAAPHVAGLAGVLLSALDQEKRGADARTLRHALMVTARPAPQGGYLDEGRGLPDLDAAYRWLASGAKAPALEVTVPGRRTSGAWIVADRPELRSGIARFEIRKPTGFPAGSYSLRTDAPWVSAPDRVTLASEVTAVELRYAVADAAPAGPRTAVVSGWTADTLAGPAFRLVTTVVIPAKIADTTVSLWTSVSVEPGATRREFFTAEIGRPFELRVSSGAGHRGVAHLHEPGGAPFREGGSRPLGTGARGAVFRVDARDVAPGHYQIATSPAPGGSLTVSAVVVHAPLTIALGHDDDVVSAKLTNVSRAPVSAGIELRLRGAQRRDTLMARGSAVQRVPFELPAWAAGLEIDIAMAPSQWARFTDFGVTVLDSAGRQVAQDPMEYAFGRLSTDLPRGHGGTRAELTLLPGFADSADGAPWSAEVTIRVYADSAVAVEREAGGKEERTIAPGALAEARFPLQRAGLWPMPAGFVPLGVVLARVGERVWTREGGLE